MSALQLCKPTTASDPLRAQECSGMAQRLMTNKKPEERVRGELSCLGMVQNNGIQCGKNETLNHLGEKKQENVSEAAHD